MMELPYRDRTAGGRALAAALREAGYGERDDLLVLALPQGGAPVGAAVAEALNAPLDLMMVRKLGVPGREELAMGAIASGGALVLHRRVAEQFGATEEQVERVIERERAELRRREWAYRGNRPEPVLAGRCLILIDDGLATGSTMQAAVEAVGTRSPAKVVVAVPVAPPDTLRAMSVLADDAVCPATPEPFYAVGRWYERFEQTSDEEVREILGGATERGG